MSEMVASPFNIDPTPNDYPSLIMRVITFGFVKSVP